MRPSQRTLRVVLIVATLVASWLGMQFVHEAGHVAGAWATGREVERVVLHPLTISRTDLAHNPRPLIVVWAGPLVGVAAPVLLWLMALAIKLGEAFLLRFFAGFCLIANGLYISGGSFQGVGDCGDMLRHGASLWQLWLFGLTTVPLGFALWHRQARHFGIGEGAAPVSVRAVVSSITICCVLLATGFLLGE
jgi:hypothetical protein